VLQCFHAMGGSVALSNRIACTCSGTAHRAPDWHALPQQLKQRHSGALWRSTCTL
jgi:hypothetical protein